MTSPEPETWTASALVAHNLRRARLHRGWSQSRAGQEIGQYLGEAWPIVKVSAAERGRVRASGVEYRAFPVDELLAMSRAFDVPIVWWFRPPDDVEIFVQSGAGEPADRQQLIDAVHGTAATTDGEEAS